MKFFDVKPRRIAYQLFQSTRPLWESTLSHQETPKLFQSTRALWTTTAIQSAPQPLHSSATLQQSACKLSQNTRSLWTTRLSQHETLKQVSHYRQLWTKVPPVPEVVMGNHTAVFAVRASLEKHDKKLHPDLCFIYIRHWLDDIHDYYFNKEWGQTKSGLPQIARRIFSELYPYHPDDALITLGQMREVKREALRQIEEDYNVPVYYGEPSIKRLPDQRFEITIQQDGQTYAFNKPDNTHFYLWYREQKPHQFSNIIQKKSTDLYHVHPSVLSKEKYIATIGSGASTMWTIKDFGSSSRTILCLKYASAQLDWSIPSNASANPDHVLCLDIEKIDIRAVDDDPNVVMIYSHEYQREFRAFLCSATGFQIPYNIVKEVPQEQLTSPKLWKFSELVSTKNIPKGSLMDSILQWFEITGNLKWAYEIQTYHKENNHFATLIKDNFSPELNVDVNYFQALESAILNLKNPLPDAQVHSFLARIYQETYQPTVSQRILFEKELDQVLQQHTVTHASCDESRTLAPS